MSDSSTPQGKEPVVPMLVRLVDREGEEIGAQKHALRYADLEPHTGSAEALSEWVGETLMPQVAKATMEAFVSQVPEEHKDAAIQAVGVIELVLGHDTPQELTWRMEMTFADSDEDEGEGEGQEA